MKEQDKMRILLEDIKSKVELIAEGHSILNAKIDRLENKVDGLEGRFDGLERRFDGLENRFDRLEKKVDQSQVMIYALNDKLDEHMRQPAHA